MRTRPFLLADADSRSQKKTPGALLELSSSVLQLVLHVSVISGNSSVLFRRISTVGVYQGKTLLSGAILIVTKNSLYWNGTKEFFLWPPALALFHFRLQLAGKGRAKSGALSVLFLALQHFVQVEADVSTDTMSREPLLSALLIDP